MPVYQYARIRLLAKNKFAETEEESRLPLSFAENLSLGAWVFNFKGKYEARREGRGCMYRYIESLEQ